jgi:hypothetical protein
MKGACMKKIFGIVALLATPIAANAQPVTIDFKATIVDASGIFAGDTGTITGSYLFNYSNADPLLSGGTVGSASGWLSGSAGASVFSTTAVFYAGQDIYSDGPPAIGDQSIVVALQGQGFLAGNQQQTDVNDFTSSALGILTSTGTPWSKKGIPVPSAGTPASGGIEVGIDNGLAPSVLDYNVTSLKVVPSAAPEINPESAASALTLLLGGLAVLQSRRSKRLKVAS